MGDTCKERLYCIFFPIPSLSYVLLVSRLSRILGFFHCKTYLHLSSSKVTLPMDKKTAIKKSKYLKRKLLVLPWLGDHRSSMSLFLR